MRGYEVGSQVQEKTGRVKVKQMLGKDKVKWIGRGRYVYMQEHKNEELTSDHRVFHMDGDVANDDPENLVAIKFTGTRYRLSRSKVIWMPSWERAKRVAVAG